MFFVPYKIEELEVRKQPRITYVLIGLNTLAFLITVFLGEARRDILFMELGFIPDELSQAYRLLTSMFLHGGWLHLGGNMFFLWLFGRAVEERLGMIRYIAFYVGAGIMGNITHLVTIPGFFSDLPCIGASGAISGVLGAFMVIAPAAKMKCFYLWILFIRPLFGTIKLPAVLFLAGWFLIQLFWGLAASDMMGVAFWAHIGGIKKVFFHPRQDKCKTLLAFGANPLSPVRQKTLRAEDFPAARADPPGGSSRVIMTEESLKRIPGADFHQVRYAFQFHISLSCTARPPLTEAPQNCTPHRSRSDNILSVGV